eukprot:TRINITY_DN187_c0_g1_i4.p1 TRINITY_DN187_c0_g1~~TRINITY_DN187_c0_g1_i4.p1  ORF type:complete len:143 (+),score=9.79 TRINITY_DN187_c0_g1_i4:204-632(+)
MLVGDAVWEKTVKADARVKLVRNIQVSWWSIASYLSWKYSEIRTIEKEHPENLERQTECFLHQCQQREISYEMFLEALDGTQHNAVASFLRRLFSSSTSTSTQVLDEINEHRDILLSTIPEVIFKNQRTTSLDTILKMHLSS